MNRTVVPFIEQDFEKYKYSLILYATEVYYTGQRRYSKGKIVFVSLTWQNWTLSLREY